MVFVVPEIRDMVECDLLCKRSLSAFNQELLNDLLDGSDFHFSLSLAISSSAICIDILTSISL
jgi:hypothetical protein